MKSLNTDVTTSPLFLNYFIVSYLKSKRAYILQMEGARTVVKEIPARSSLEEILRAWHIPLYQPIISLSATTEMMQALIDIGIEQLALVTMILHFELEGKKLELKRNQIDYSVTYLLENLRSLVRRTDIVFVHNYTFLFVLPGANLEGGTIVQTRLWDALLWRIHSTSNLALIRPSAILLGYSAYPAPCTTLQECLETAMLPQRRFEQSSEKILSGVPQFDEQMQEADLPELARQLGIPYLSLLPRKVPPHIQGMIDPRLAQELHCYPLGCDEDVLTVALADPQNRSVLDRLEKETGFHIFPVLAHPHELQNALEQLI
jgi:hypothetical protein